MSYHSQSPSGQAVSNCQLCSELDNMKMVQCDTCDLWFHYICVNVTSDIENRDWICQKCIKSGIPKHASCATNSTIHQRKLSTSLSRKSNTSSSKRLELELQKLEEMRKIQEDERLLRMKNDQEYLERKYQLLNKIADIDGSETVNPDCINTNQKLSRKALGANVSSCQIQIVPQVPIIQSQLNTDIQDNVVKLEGPSHVNNNDHNFTHATMANNLPSAALASSSLEQNLLNGQFFPNKQQLAARQAVPKELPTFSGSPEEWPLFISTYEGSSRVCGFSNEENLIRLQKCLKGNALEAVRYRLLLPSCVPGVISTLRMLYGRPELIIHVLIQKTRALPAPKVDKLETLVNFSLAVQNLCATIEASDLSAHLCNPVLLQELVEKLPASIKLNWAIFKQTLPMTNLSHFNSWLCQIGEAASSIILPNSIVSSDATENVKRKFKENIFLNIHSEEPIIETKNSVADHAPAPHKCSVCRGSCATIADCQSFLSLSLHEKWLVVRSHGLCRKCLQFHGNYRCKVTTVCGQNGCTFKHHQLLHNTKKDSNQVVKTVETSSIISHHNFSSFPPNVQSPLFRVVPVILHGKNCKISTYAFLDDGSSLTLMEEELAGQLNLSGNVAPLCLQWTANTHRLEENSQRVNIGISGIMKQSKTYCMPNVRTVKSLQLPSQSMDVEYIKTKYPHLKKIPIKSYNEIQPRILIGLDNWKLGLCLKTIEGHEDQLVASKTRLGWLVYGSFFDEKKETVGTHISHTFHMCECKQDVDDDLQQIVKHYFSLESLGVTKPEKKIMSAEDQRAFDILDSTTYRKGSHFQTSLLWKYDDFYLPDSFLMAKKRLVCLENRISRDPKLAETLKQHIRDYIAKGYARKLSNDEINEHHARKWYLPIFPVINPNKPGKFRIVWDAAAKVNGISLNSVLLKGPDQLVALPSIMCKFRERKIAICGNIREMFHQVRMKEEDQHCQRFLWRDGDIKRAPDTYVMQVMTFGATCSPSCAQFAKNKNAQDFISIFPRATEAIIDNHYVDDLLDSVNTETEAIQLANEVKYIHQKGGFEIRNWMSNSPKVLKALCENGITERNLSAGCEVTAEKVLGMWWCTTTDSFTYKVTPTAKNTDILLAFRRPTKREVLRILMSIFDPLGLLANFLMYVKILLREIWRSAIAWDEEIGDQQYSKWLVWIRLLPELSTISIPRCYFKHESSESLKDIQIHTFVDASENGYCAVRYFRFCVHERIECILVAAKTRVAPMKFQSIPRLELQAALLGSRLAHNVLNSHSITATQRFYWSDSKTVLSWLRSDHKRYRQFVAYRVSEILDATELADWRWIPTKLNVADEGTKWQENPDFTAQSRWFVGPEFLRDPIEKWPRETSSSNVNTEEELIPHFAHSAITQTRLIDFQRFSNWKRLLRSTAYVLRLSTIQDQIKCIFKIKLVLSRKKNTRRQKTSFIATYKTKDSLAKYQSSKPIRLQMLLNFRK